MKVLFIGPYRQADAWGVNSRCLLKSLDMIEEIDLATRPIFFSGGGFQDPIIDRLESVRHPEFDVVIQHTLPSYLSYTGLAKRNVCFTPVETIDNKGWSNYLNLMDDIFVCTSAEKNALPEELQERASVIGGAIPGDMARKENIPDVNYKFYFSGGSLEEKGGAKAVLDAYLSEFHTNENVYLVIHTTDKGKAEQMIQDSRKRVGKFPHIDYSPSIEIAPDCFAEELHQVTHCVVDVASTIDFSLDIAAGMAMGNPAIVLDKSGMSEHITEDNGWLVKSHEDVLLCPDRPLADMFTAREKGLVPHISSLRECMREAFTSTKKNEKSSVFSLENQAATLKEILCM
tara:strand:+ start:283 stop:1314 length:1032 start_codon:yes stop_codon:yes gene_type:complete